MAKYKEYTLLNAKWPSYAYYEWWKRKTYLHDKAIMFIKSLLYTMDYYSAIKKNEILQPLTDGPRWY